MRCEVPLTKNSCDLNGPPRSCCSIHSLIREIVPHDKIHYESTLLVPYLLVPQHDTRQRDSIQAFFQMIITPSNHTSVALPSFVFIGIALSSDMVQFSSDFIKKQLSYSRNSEFKWQKQHFFVDTNVYWAKIV